VVGAGEDVACDVVRQGLVIGRHRLRHRLPVDEAEVRGIGASEHQPSPADVYVAPWLTLKATDPDDVAADAATKRHVVLLDDLDVVEGDELVRHRGMTTSPQLRASRNAHSLSRRRARRG